MPQHISQSVGVCLLNIYIQIKGADHAVLDSYCRFLITAGKALDIDIGGRYSEHKIPYSLDQTPRLLFISSPEFMRRLFESGDYSKSGVY